MSGVWGQPDSVWILGAGALFAAALTLAFLRRRRVRDPLAARPARHLKTADAPFAQNTAFADNGATVIAIVHHTRIPRRAETRRYPYLGLDEAIAVVRAIREAPPSRPIHIVLHTRGGLSSACEMIAQALRAHPGGTVAFVPYYAMSAGTVVALAADKIVYGHAAALGPIDTQYYGFPVGAYADLAKRKSARYVQDELLMMGFVAKKVMEDDEQVLCKLINRNHGKGDPCSIAEYLSKGTHDHGFRVTIEKARELKINASTDMPQAMYDLVDGEIATVEKEVKAEEQKDGPPPPTLQL
jgi:ClpP class serine protease